MKHVTNYFAQKNRCPNCGHKLLMADNRFKCGVETGSENDNTIWVTCPCKVHRRVIADV